MNIRKNSIVSFNYWTITPNGWVKTLIENAKITYVYKAIGPLGCSIIPIYFYAIVNGEKKMFHVEHIA